MDNKGMTSNRPLSGGVSPALLVRRLAVGRGQGARGHHHYWVARWQLGFAGEEGSAERLLALFSSLNNI